MINTAEQMGGALGIAIAASRSSSASTSTRSSGRLRNAGIDPTDKQCTRSTISSSRPSSGASTTSRGLRVVREAFDYLMQAHIDAFQVMFVSSAGIAVVGAIACLVLVRRRAASAEGPVFGRRSRWIYANQGRTAAITRHRPTG